MAMQPPDDFHVLRRRVRLQGTLTTRTALRIGAGSGGLDDAVDLPVLRDGQGYPVIPGASLKGVLRSTLEGIVRGAGGTPGGPLAARGLWSCEPLAKGCGHHSGGGREQVDTGAHCALCRLFGSQVVASHVRISDAMMSRREDTPPIELRDGVSIDRDLGTVHPGQKYDFQVVSPGTAFALELFADNVDDAQLGLLMAGFDQIAEGFSAIGGFTSRGLGRVDLGWESLVDFAPAALLGGAEARKAAMAPRPLADADRDRWSTALATLAGGDH